MLRRFGVPRRDLDDVYQNLLLSMGRTLRTYSPETCTLTTWLFGAARHHALAYLQRERSFEERNLAAAAEGRTLVSQPPLGPEAHILFEELRRFLHATLAGMKPPLGDVLEYRELLGLSFVEIADVLCAPETTVRRWYDAARAELEAAFKARFAERSRRGAAVLPISLAVLLDSERKRLASLFDEDMGPGLDRPPATLAARAGNDPGSPLAELVRAAPALPRLPSDDETHRRRRSPVAAIARSRGAAFLAGGVVGAALVWLFLRTTAPQPPPVSTSPEADALLGTPEPFATAVGAMMPLVPLPPTGSRLPPSSSASAAPQRTAEHIGATDHGLILGAREAIRRRNFGEARQLLLEHARQFPTSKLRLLRESLLASLPQAQ